MSFALTITALVAVLAIAWRLLGAYIVGVYEGRVGWLGFIERAIYRIVGVDRQREQSWKRYGDALIVFSGVALLFTYAIFRLQGVLVQPATPEGRNAGAVVEHGRVVPDEH
jgi:K+-transporting ATPase ATPase A chain